MYIALHKIYEVKIMKKFIAIVMALIMMMSICVSAFAEEGDVIIPGTDAGDGPVYEELGIVSITAEAHGVLVQGVDSYVDTYYDDDGKESTCEYYNLVNANIIYTVTYEDGTVVTADENELAAKYDLYIIDMTDYGKTPFVVGKNTAVLDCYGYEFTCEIEVVANIYTGIEISGENELTIKFLTADGKNTHTTKVVDITYISEDVGFLEMGIVCDDGRHYDIIYNYAYDEATGDTFGYIMNISIEIAGLKSNTLPVNYWMLVRTAMESYMYYSFAYSIMNDSPTGFDINDPQKSVDIIVAMSVMMLDYEPAGIDDEYFYHEVDLATAQQYIIAAFGLDGLDLTKSKYYDATSKKICIDEPISGDEIYSQDYMTYADGEWIMNGAVFANQDDYKADKKSYDIEIVFDMEKGLNTIEFTKAPVDDPTPPDQPDDPTPPTTEVVGDANGDGKVTAVDARAILQYVAGMKNENEVVPEKYMDVNGDGRVSAVDARWVLQMVAGLL